MKKISTALAGAILTATLVVSPASAAQIILNSSMIIGNVGQFNSSGAPTVNQQTGAVAAGLGTYQPGSSGALTFDLGQEYDLGSIDLFSSGGSKFLLQAGNSVTYNGWGSWVLNSGGNLVNGALTADGGSNLAAQSFQIGSTEKFRYLQLTISPFAQGGVSTMDEFRVFDREVVSAVPEPATWAMMIMGFGLAGSAIRRRSTVFRTA